MQKKLERIIRLSFNLVTVKMEKSHHKSMYEKLAKKAKEQLRSLGEFEKFMVAEEMAEKMMNELLTEYVALDVGEKATKKNNKKKQTKKSKGKPTLNHVYMIVCLFMSVSR